MKGPFADKCRQVCEAHDWELLPTGVFVRFGDGRGQLVRLEFFEHELEELVRFSSVIGAIDSLSRERLVTALRANSGFAHGGLAIIEDDLCVVDTLIIAGAEARAVAAIIEYLARSADEYERIVFGVDEN